jgi:hypothetical protein
MGEDMQDTGTERAGPLEAALQDPAGQGSGDTQSTQAGASGAGEGANASRSEGRASFTTPDAVAALHDVAANAESFSDPIAGGEQAGAEMLEAAKRDPGGH